MLNTAFSKTYDKRWISFIDQWAKCTIICIITPAGVRRVSRMAVIGHSSVLRAASTILSYTFGPFAGRAARRCEGHG